MKSKTHSTATVPAVLAILLAACSTGAFAQATTTATATGTVITTIGVTKTVDMNFGNVAVQASSGGTVVMTPVAVRSATGGVTLPTNAGTVTAASFAITGQGSYTYAITLPSMDLTITSGSNTMAVNTFTSSPTATGTLSVLGTQTLNVGATLNVAAGQPAGVYLSPTPFSVTVNYN
jgi:Domain of unknown function (DUF4402)